MMSYGSEDLCFIFANNMYLNCGCIQLFGDQMDNLTLGNKDKVTVTSRPKHVLGELFKQWLGKDANMSSIKDEVRNLLAMNTDFTDWVEQAYVEQLSDRKKPLRSIKSQIADILDGDCRILYNVMHSLANADDDYTKLGNRVMLSNVKWITKMLKDEDNLSLVKTTPKWLSKLSDVNHPNYDDDNYEQNNEDVLFDFQLLERIGAPDTTPEESWKANIAVWVLYRTKAVSLPYKRKRLARGCALQTFMNMVALWLLGEDNDISPKQMEVYLSEVYRIVQPESMKEWVIRALFSPWLICPLLTIEAPQYANMWKRLTQHGKHFTSVTLTSIYGTTTWCNVMKVNWQLMSDILSGKVGTQCAKSGTPFHKWLSLFHQCYIIQLSNIGVPKDDFVSLARFREDAFAQQDKEMLTDLINRCANENQHMDMGSASYKIKYNLAVFLRRTSYVWMWMAYACTRNIPSWLTTNKLAFMEYKNQSHDEKYQTLILEQIYEQSEHSLAHEMNHIVDNIHRKHPTVHKPFLQKAFEQLANEQETALCWLPQDFKNCLGLKMLPGGSFCTGEAYLINKTICDGISTVQQKGVKMESCLDEPRMQKIVSSMPFTPDTTQQNFVANLVTNPISILNGPPGCGKTATLHLFNLVAKALRWSVAYLGPTGRTVTRLTQLIPDVEPYLYENDHETIGKVLNGSFCLTLDRMVYPFFHAPISNLQPDVIVVDESSMVNSFIAAKLFYLIQKCKKVPKVIFVGDPDQLFPVEAGSFFVECIKSRAIPIFSLTKVYRQSALNLLRTCQNILNYDASKHFEDIVLRDPDSLADCTTVRGRERVKADEYKKMLMQDYKSSCRAIPNSVIARKIICPRTQGRLGVVEMNFIGQTVWHQTFTTTPSTWSIYDTTKNGKVIKSCMIKTSDNIYRCQTPICNVDRATVNFESKRGIVKKWLTYKPRKNGHAQGNESFQSADWSVLSQTNFLDTTHLTNGEFCYLPGDPVMAQSEIKSMRIMNGDEFIISGWLNDEKSEYVMLQDDMRKRLVILKISLFWKHFAPSFAITAHKSQGSEYPHVFIVMPWVDVEEETLPSASSIPEPKYPYYRLLSKRLLYTSITRTKSI